MKIWELEVGKKYKQNNYEHAWKDSIYFINDTRKLFYLKNGESYSTPIRYNLLVEIDFEEVVELPKLTDDEKGFLRIMGIEYNYVARDKDNSFFFYKELPIKGMLGYNCHSANLNLPFFNNEFKSIKPMDCQKISDLIEV